MMFSLLVTLLLSCDGSPPPTGDAPGGLSDLPPLPPLARTEQVRGAARAAPVDLRIALVGEVRGELEPCGCPTLPYGGFVRRQRLLDELRAADGGPLFHLDAGETLLKGFSSARTDRRTRAETILALSRAVGVDVWAPGPSDLATIGIDGILRAGVPAISATWQDPAGQLLLPSHRIVTRDGVRLGVIGLSGVPTDPADREQVQGRDPVLAAQQALAAIAAEARAVDLVVALGSLSDADALRVSAAVPGLAAILSTQGSAYAAPSASPGEALRIESPDRGRYVALVHARVGTDAGGPLVLLPEGQAWRDWLTLQAQVRQRPDDAALLAALVALEQDRTAVGAGRNLAHVESIPLSEAYDGPAAAVSTQVDAFKEEALQQAAARAARETTPLEPGYASAGACVNCHTQEMARWTFSDHARAWESLVKREATDDPECVGCHTTGFGEVGGFGELSPPKLRKYKAVQCEACHGPLRGHPGATEIQAQPVTPERCVVCHDAANSPDFDYATYLPRASCQPPDGG